MKNWTLSNSMKAVICDVNIQEIVSVGMFFHVGSQNETENTNGITHLLEHVLSDQFLDYWWAFKCPYNKRILLFFF